MREGYIHCSFSLWEEKEVQHVEREWQKIKKTGTGKRTIFSFVYAISRSEVRIYPSYTSDTRRERGGRIEPRFILPWIHSEASSPFSHFLLSPVVPERAGGKEQNSAVTKLREMHRDFHDPSRKTNLYFLLCNVIYK